MAKRKPLVAPDELTDELKKSTGRGLGALFAPAPPTEVTPEPEDEALPETSPQKQARKPRGKQSNLPGNKQISQQESNITSNITILQLNE